MAASSRWNTVSETIATRPKKTGIKVGGERLAPQTAQIYAQSFPQNPVLTYILTPRFPTPRERKAFLPRYFRILCLAASLNGGIFILAGEIERFIISPLPSPSFETPPIQNSQTQTKAKQQEQEREIVPESSALLLPPGAKIDSLSTLWKSGFLGLAWEIGPRGMWRMGKVQRSMGGMVVGALSNSPYTSPAPPSPSSQTQNTSSFPSLLRTGGKTMRYYHLHQLATRPASRGKGLSKVVLDKVKELVEREGRREPVWLEATSEEGRRVYEKAGWRVVGIGRVGEGWVSASGEREEDGEGVRIWGMVWWPEERVEIG